MFNDIWSDCHFYLLHPDSSLSFPWVKSRSSKSQEAIPETESTQHSHKAVNSKLDVSHEILTPMTEGFTSEDSIGDHKCVGSTVCHKWNTSLPESKNIGENCKKDDHNEMQDSSQEWAFYSEALHGFKSGMGFLFEALHAENAKPKDSESILSVTSNQQSATHAGPTTQSQAAQSPVSNPLWNGDSKLNMAPPQCSDEEIHSGQEWEESGKYSDANESTIIFISPCWKNHLYPDKNYYSVFTNSCERP